MKKFIVVCAVIAVALGIFLFTAQNRPAQIPSNKIKVVTTLFPLYDMAKNIGGDKADTTLLLPPGTEAHSFEPKPSDIVKIGEADIFVYTGKFMEPWAEDVLKSVDNKNLIVVDASQGVKMIPGDPHIWLDFDNAKQMVKNIAQAFEARDSADSAFYEQTAQNYSNKLTELDSLYRTALATCRNKEIVYGGHYAFGYLASRYGLKYLAAQGISPDSEPTAKDLADLADQIKKNNIKYVFYEELASPKIAETIAGETNAKMLLLNAAHNVTKDQFENNISFSDILLSDLNNLKIGLECY
jgi:zinc transport system substrate-binding protein